MRATCVDIGAGNFDLIQIVDRAEGFDGAAGIVNGNRGMVCELVQKSPRRPSGSRVGQRLVERVPATGIVEGFDAQGHDDQPFP